MPTIPYVKQTWTDGVSSASAARFGVLESGIFEVSYAPAVRVFHNANQSIANNTLTALAFNSERIDQAGNAADTMHDTVTNNSRLTCRYAGVYQISASIQWAAGTTGLRNLHIRHQGTTLIAVEGMPAPASGGGLQSITTLYPLAVNEYVEVVVSHTQGAALNIEVAGNYSPEFSMVRVA